MVTQLSFPKRQGRLYNMLQLVKQLEQKGRLMLVLQVEVHHSLLVEDHLSVHNNRLSIINQPLLVEQLYHFIDYLKRIEVHLLSKVLEVVPVLFYLPGRLYVVAKSLLELEDTCFIDPLLEELTRLEHDVFVACESQLVLSLIVLLQRLIEALLKLLKIHLDQVGVGLYELGVAYDFVDYQVVQIGHLVP